MENIQDSSLWSFVDEFTYTIIKTLSKNTHMNYLTEPREVIHDDIIPKLHDKIIHPALGKKTIAPQFPRRPIINQNIRRRDFGVQTPESTMQTSMYGKIEFLIKDPSVRFIKCSGENKPIMINRNGINQITNIKLTSKEIRELVKNISNEAHLPLVNGVFRAVVDDYAISAIVSNMIGTRFLIKK